MTGKFITIDGLDGCGKSTQTKALLAYLSPKQPTILLREPGGTKIGERIRDILLHGSDDMDLRTEILLFSASRAQIYQSTIIPALEQGTTVITDRWAWSTIAYQGCGGVSIDQIWSLTK